MSVGILGERRLSAPPPPAPRPAIQAPLPPQDFRLGQVYAFPNPARYGASPTIHVEAGVADSVELRFYDMAGDLAHRAELQGPPQTIDDGQGPEYAYEYVWRGSIPSGVYLCVVKVRKSGSEDLRRIVKLAVIR